MNSHRDARNLAASERDRVEITAGGTSEPGRVRDIKATPADPGSDTRGSTVGLGQGRLLFAGRLKGLTGMSVAVMFDDGSAPVVIADDLEPEAAEDLIRSVARAFEERRSR